MNTKKLFKKLMKEKLWLFLLILATGFFFFPVRVIMLRQAILDDIRNGLDRSFSSVASVLGINADYKDKLLILLLVVIAAFITAGVSFHYLHDVSRTDFWMSLPIKRKKRFMLHFLSGALSAVIPFVIVFLASGIICFVTGMLTGAGISAFFLSMLSLILVFFAVYLLSCLCHVLTGRTVIGVLLTGFFLVIGPGAIYLFEGLCGCFLTHYISDINTGAAVWFSPATLASLSDISGRIIFALIYSVIFLVLALIAVERRPAEAAGNSFSFRWLPLFIKIAVTTAGSLFFGLFLSAFGSGDLRIWFLFFMVIAALLLPMVMDLIFSMDLRAIKKNWKLNLLSFAIPIVISIFFAADIAGYDRFVPKENEVASVGIIGDDSMDYQGSLYVLGESPDKTHYSKEPVSIEEAARFVQNNNPNRDGNYILKLVFNLKSGKVVKRQYPTSYDEIRNLYDVFSKDEKYREDIALAKKLEHTDEKTIFALSPYDPDRVIEGETVILNLDGKERQSLIDALVKDESKMTYSEYERSTPTYLIEVRRSYDEGGASGVLSIYPEFTETLEVLKDFM